MKKKQFIVGTVMFGISAFAFIFVVTLLFEVLMLATIETTEALGLIVILPLFLIALFFSIVPSIVAIIMLSISTKSEKKALKILSIVFLVFSIIILVVDVVSGLILIAL